MPKRALKLRDAIEAYEHEMRADDMARSTIASRMIVLNGLTRTVGNPWMSSLGPVDIREYFRTQAHLSGRSHNMYMSRLRRFLVWAREQDQIRLSPDELLSKVKERRIELSERLWLSEDQALELIERQKYPRDRAFTVVALDTASRGGEMARYRIHDVNLDRGTINKTITKHKHVSARVDTLALTPEGDRELRRWLAIYATELGMTLAELIEDHPNYFLFPSHVTVARTSDFSGPRLPKLRPELPISTPWKIIGRVLRDMGITTEDAPRVGVHVTRRTTARLIRDSTHDIRVAQAVLGHESQKTTEIYLGASEDQLRRNDVLRAGGWRTAKPEGGKIIPLRREG